MRIVVEFGIAGEVEINDGVKVEDEGEWEWGKKNEVLPLPGKKFLRAGGHMLQGPLQRGKWTQLASSLAQGGKNSTLKGGRIPRDIWVILMIVL